MGAAGFLVALRGGLLSAAGLPRLARPEDRPLHHRRAGVHAGGGPRRPRVVTPPRRRTVFAAPGPHGSSGLGWRGAPQTGGDPSSSWAQPSLPQESLLRPLRPTQQTRPGGVGVETILVQRGISIAASAIVTSLRAAVGSSHFKPNFLGQAPATRARAFPRSRRSKSRAARRSFPFLSPDTVHR